MSFQTLPKLASKNWNVHDLMTQLWTYYLGVFCMERKTFFFFFNCLGLSWRSVQPTCTYDQHQNSSKDTDWVPHLDWFLQRDTEAGLTTAPWIVMHGCHALWDRRKKKKLCSRVGLTPLFVPRCLRYPQNLRWFSRTLETMDRSSLQTVRMSSEVQDWTTSEFRSSCSHYLIVLQVFRAQFMHTPPLPAQYLPRRNQHGQSKEYHIWKPSLSIEFSVDILIFRTSFDPG